MYKNFIFDLYGTLIDLGTDEKKDKLWETLALYYSYNGAIYDKNELRKHYFGEVKKALEKNKLTSYPDVKIEKVFKRLYRNKDIDVKESVVIQTTRLFRILSTDYIKLYYGVKETLLLIKKQEKKIFLLSNGQREFSIPEMKYLGIYKSFDGIYFSSDCGICKPDKNFYNYLMEKEKIKPEESIMIGNDHNTDIEGANNAGMDALYIYTNHSPKVKNFDCKFKIMDGDFIKIRDLLFTNSTCARINKP